MRQSQQSSLAQKSKLRVYAKTYSAFNPGPNHATAATQQSRHAKRNVVVRSQVSRYVLQYQLEFRHDMLIPSQPCPPHSSRTLATSTKKTPKPTPTPTKPAKPTHSTCGGGRAGSLSCSPGYTCVDDPYSQGCGLACDGLGICVEDKMCGGFPGFPCQVKGQVCNDDPRDECDPKNGGADCGGLCMWPH